MHSIYVIRLTQPAAFFLFQTIIVEKFCQRRAWIVLIKCLLQSSDRFPLRGGVMGERRLAFHLRHHARSQDYHLGGCRRVLGQVTGAGLHASCLRQAPPVLPRQITVLGNVCFPMTPRWHVFWTTYNLFCTFCGSAAREVLRSHSLTYLPPGCHKGTLCSPLKHKRFRPEQTRRGLSNHRSAVANFSVAAFGLHAGGAIKSRTIMMIVEVQQRPERGPQHRLRLAVQRHYVSIM